MTLPAAITDHVRQGLARLVTPFKDRPRFAAWCASVLEAKQELEDALQKYAASWDVDTCDLPRLTILGLLVGQTPVGSLETFRRLVKARILVNRSDTSAPTLIKIARLLFDGDVWYTEGDCAIVIEARTPLSIDVDGSVLVSLLRLAKMGGVSLNVFAQLETDTFLLGGDGSDAIADSAHGLSDGDASGGSTTLGGYLSGDF